VCFLLIVGFMSVVYSNYTRNKCIDNWDKSNNISSIEEHLSKGMSSTGSGRDRRNCDKDNPLGSYFCVVFHFCFPE